MKKEVIVLSLGGSLIIPDKVNYSYLKEFKKIILKNSKKYKFIIVCGGGSLARKYIEALNKSGADQKLQSLSGISATRTNARFMNYFFKINPEKGIPHKTKQIKNYLKKLDVIFCGGLEYKPHQTSDSTAADLARKLNSKFVNLTNIKGLYTDNPLTNKKAKFIPKISWKDFEKMANRSKFKPGQHFVLDQTAAAIIRKNKIPTFIIGKDINQLENLLKGKRFIGTKIEG
jgi:uridylate kinase